MEMALQTPFFLFFFFPSQLDNTERTISQPTPSKLIFTPKPLAPPLRAEIPLSPPFSSHRAKPPYSSTQCYFRPLLHSFPGACSRIPVALPRASTILPQFWFWFCPE